MVDFLIEHECNVNATNNSKDTALHIAAAKGLKFLRNFHQFKL